MSLFFTTIADRNFKGPFYTLAHVRYRLKRDTGVLERGLGSVGGMIGIRADAIDGAEGSLMHQRHDPGKVGEDSCLLDVPQATENLLLVLDGL